MFIFIVPGGVTQQECFHCALFLGGLCPSTLLPSNVGAVDNPALDSRNLPLCRSVQLFCVFALIPSKSNGTSTTLLQTLDTDERLKQETTDVILIVCGIEFCFHAVKTKNTHCFKCL